MTHRIRLFFCLGPIACLSVLGQAQPHTATAEIDFSPRTAIASWVGGFMVDYTRAIDRTTPSVWMIDRDGKPVTPPVPISFPDAPSVDIHAVTADSMGNLYASVEAWAPGGTGTGVICVISPGGKSVRAIRTGDFLPVALAVTKAGEVWAFGVPLELQATRSTQTDYPALWRIDASGRVVDKLVPRSSFGKDVIPTHASGDAGSPHLWATSTRVGLYSATANRWMEFDEATGTTLTDLHAPRPMLSDGTKAALTMVAMTESGDVFAHWGFLKAKTAEEGSGFYMLDRSKSKWVLQAEPPCPDGCERLYGADGDKLIMRSGRATSHSLTFAWVEAGSMAPALK